ncbi:C40 family peptidase [Kitasatospora azatica]|uniref:C40 family peptidase n=1 Tax=Kitasatospora azatica TaxID=58347 RepID=UPI00055ACB49|nr:C40 family peptidase [Kitasatospora azatica]
MPRRLRLTLLLALTVLAGSLASPAVPSAGAVPSAVAVAEDPVPSTVAVAEDPAPSAVAVAEEPAAPDGAPYPSTGEIAQAQAEADRRARAATAIEAQLAGAKTELDRAALVAEQAVEAYNGAQVRLAAARTAAAAATARAAAAQAARAEAAEDAASLAAATYRAGTTPELSAIDALLGARGPRAAGEQAAAVGAAGRTTRQILDAATATAQAAAEAARAASDATDTAERAAGAVEQAKAQAQARVTEQQQLVVGLDRRRERLLGELAAARDTTVELELRRQAALEAIAAKQAEEAAKAAAAARAQQEAEAQADAARAQADAARAQHPDAAPPKAAPWSEVGAQAALDFARAKLGLPYIWGGEGPTGYDCSGLTMLAWRQGGKRLTHFAADQYAESTPVNYRQLRPGDLVFWTHTGRAADIYHVAIYLGDDQIIEAPRPGAAIKQASLWIMGPPDFYARP